MQQDQVSHTGAHAERFHDGGLNRPALATVWPVPPKKATNPAKLKMLAYGSLNAIFVMLAALHADSSARRSRKAGISRESGAGVRQGVVKLVMSPLLGSGACSPYVPTIGVAWPNVFGVSVSMCPRFGGQGAPTIGDGVLLFLATVLRGPLSLNFDPAQFKNSRVGDRPR